MEKRREWGNRRGEINNAEQQVVYIARRVKLEIRVSPFPQRPNFWPAAFDFQKHANVSRKQEKEGELIIFPTRRTFWHRRRVIFWGKKFFKRARAKKKYKSWEI